MNWIQVQFTYYASSPSPLPMVEYLKVLSLSVEPAYASLTVEPMAALLVERATHPDGPYGRAPPDLMVEPACAS
jgi:hypothetical protein